MTENKINRDVVLAQIRNLVDPLFLSNEILQHIETYFQFDDIQEKAQQGKVTRNAVSEFIVQFTHALRKNVKSSGRTVIEVSDIDAAFADVKASCPF